MLQPLSINLPVLFFQLNMYGQYGSERSSEPQTQLPEETYLKECKTTL